MQVLVVYPVTIELENVEGMDIEAIREKVLNEADHIITTSGIKPIIQDCNEMPELVE